MIITSPYLQPPLMPEAICAVSTRFSAPGKSQEFDLSSAQAEQANFLANAARLQKDLGLNALAGLRQVHGRRMVEVNQGNLGPDMPEADALFTTTAGVGLMIRQADCQAIVLSAPGLVANLHVGWRGNVQNLPGRALARLCQKFRISPRHFRAYISPSLGPCCAEFVNYRHEFPKEFTAFMVSPNHFNLWAVSAWQLVSQGLARGNLSISGICTKCSQNFYSFRRGDSGRFATVVALKLNEQ